LALELFLFAFFVAIVVGFAIGFILDAPGSLGLGCGFAAAWYMAIGGIGIVGMALDPGSAIAVLTWFTFYGLVAGAIIFAACVLGTLLGMLRRLALRSFGGGAYD
jgi:hypothetical protein